MHYGSRLLFEFLRCLQKFKPVGENCRITGKKMSRGLGALLAPITAAGDFLFGLRPLGVGLFFYPDPLAPSSPQK